MSWWMMFRQKNRQKPSTGRIVEEKKEAKGAGNLPDFFSGTSELDMRMMSCEANITLISQCFTLKMTIFWVFVLTQQRSGKAPLGHIIMHVNASSAAFDFLNCYQGQSNKYGMIKKKRPKTSWGNPSNHKNAY